MKITLANVPYPPYEHGGAERSMALLAEALARIGHTVSVITLHPKPNEIVEDRNGVTVYRLPLDNIYWPYDDDRRPGMLSRFRWHAADIWNKRAAERVGVILDIVKPDVMHTSVISGFSAAIWQAAKERNIRIVHTLRDYYLLCARSSLMRRNRVCVDRCVDCRFLTHRRTLATSMVDAVCSVSRHVLARHEQAGCFARAEKAVIYNIAGSESHKATMNVEQAHNGLPRAVKFGFIGRVKAEKGIEVLLRASSMLTNPLWRLKIAGTGAESYVARLRAEHRDARVEWLGVVDRDSFYDSIDVLIVPSIWSEPLSRVLIEGIDSGLPVLCAESGGIPEIAQLGKSVVTYPPVDALSLAEKMETILNHTGPPLTGGWKSFDDESLFSEEYITSKYLELYRGRSL